VFYLNFQKKSEYEVMSGLRNAAVLSMIVLLATLGCSRQEGGVSANAESPGDAKTEAFNAYLEFKHIRVRDEAHRQSLYAQYMEREKEADKIESEPLLDKKLINAELNEFRKEMLISRYFEKFLQEKVSEEAVHNYYAANAEKYQDRKVHVAHILVRIDKNMGEPERQAKLTTAQEVYSKLKTGADFSEIAKQYSEDAISSKKGGDLGWLREGAIDTRFSKTVFSMEPNQISEPFETAFGFHVVKLLEGPVVVKKPFEAVSGDIRYQLRNQAKDAELKRLLGKRE
jgi:peptidyl-prolyl cis-trans isomerase C